MERWICITKNYVTGASIGGTIGSRDGSSESTVCDYAALSKNGTCLKYVHGAIVDIRGNNKDECLLFRRGKALGRRGK